MPCTSSKHSYVILHTHSLSAQNLKRLPSVATANVPSRSVAKAKVNGAHRAPFNALAYHLLLPWDENKKMTRSLFIGLINFLCMGCVSLFEVISSPLFFLGKLYKWKAKNKHQAQLEIELMMPSLPGNLTWHRNSAQTMFPPKVPCTSK